MLAKRQAAMTKATAGATAPQTADEEEAVARFRKMMRVGIPPSVVSADIGRAGTGLFPLWCIVNTPHKQHRFIKRCAWRATTPACWAATKTALALDPLASKRSSKSSLLVVLKPLGCGAVCKGRVHECIRILPVAFP